MRLWKVGLLLLAVVIAAAGWPGPVEQVLAGRGTPGSASFGLGAVLELDGPYRGDALAIATDLPLDWLAITLPWVEYDGPPGASPAWQRLDRVMQFASRQNLAVLFSLTKAPPAVTGPDGPQPDRTAAFVTALAARYPALQAVELFPRANTRAGWGGAPNPRAYLRVYRAVDSALSAAGKTLVLPAGGLLPTQVTRAGEEINDLDYLQALLAEAKAAPLPVISMDLSGARGDPFDNPLADLTALRRYELAREIMAQNSHQKGLIWITAFQPPSGKIEKPNQNPNLINANTHNWFYQSIAQLRSQLYIGVVIYQSLNPAANGGQTSALIQSEQEFHPNYRILRELIAQNAPEAGITQKGRPKNGLLTKKHP